MVIIHCGKGHYYDPDRFGSCPECARREEPEGAFVEVPEYTFVEVPEIDEEMLGVLAPELDHHVSCIRGHIYKGPASEVCPICGSPEQNRAVEQRIWRQQQKKDPPSLAEADNLSQTLIFAVDGGLSYQLWTKGNRCYLTARVLLYAPWPVLENTVEVPGTSLMQAWDKILWCLHENNADTQMKSNEQGSGDSRLWIDINPVRCDYRGSSWNMPNPGGKCLRTVCRILGDLFANNREDRFAQRKDRDNLAAELEYGVTNCSLKREGRDYRMEVTETIYYEGFQSFTLRDSVVIPENAGRVLLRWLSNCGLMEALIQKNMRPEDNIHRDPAVATVFWLRNGHLEFCYHDWDKDNNDREREVLRQAMEEMLSCFACYREEGIDMTYQLP